MGGVLHFARLADREPRRGGWSRGPQTTLERSGIALTAGPRIAWSGFETAAARELPVREITAPVLRISDAASRRVPRRSFAAALPSAVLLGTLWASAVPVFNSGLLAQGVATGAISGAVRAEDGANVDGALVRVVNLRTGRSVVTGVRDGRFLVDGLDIGGPYVVFVRRIGFSPQQSVPLFLSLGERQDLAFTLQVRALALDTIVLVATPEGARADPGVGTTISDSLLHRLPSLNQEELDFVRLAPEVSTKIGLTTSGLQTGGMSGGGVGFRLNNYLLDGVPERFIGPNVPLAWGGGRSIPMEAVREYEVLVAPFDVRYGDFAGALVNTVTASGTNELHGSVYGSARNDALAGEGVTAYDRQQLGFALGGPIVRDRLHFFVASEVQQLAASAPTATPPVNVSSVILDSLNAIMRAYGLTPGSGTRVQNRTPVANIFGRLDLALPGWNSRVVAELNYAYSSPDQFSQVQRDTFFLSTYQYSLPTWSRLASLRFETTLPRPGGWHNELTVSDHTVGSRNHPEVSQPLVLVAVPAANGQTVTLKTGSNEVAQGSASGSWTVRLADVLTVPVGSGHEITVGIEAERFRANRSGVNNAYGTWTFGSLALFEAGTANKYVRREDFGGAQVALRGGQYAAFVGDRWRAGDHVELILGLRADLLSLSGHAPYNAAVDSVFHRRTDQMPRERAYWSPRLGVTWDPSGSGRDRVRGGVGVFTSRPPLGWLYAALYNYGTGIGVLSCGGVGGVGPPPAFVADYRQAPGACATGGALTPAARGDVDLLDRNLRLARTLKISLAYDRRLPWGVLSTSEALFTRSPSDYVFVNLNLQGPQAVDRYGRVLYGTVQPDGTPIPAVRWGSGSAEVIDLENTSRNWSSQLIEHVEKRFSRDLAASASYTYSRVRDVETPLRLGVPAIVTWGAARPVSGRLDDLSPGISLNDIPHRIVVSLTYTAPWRRWPTAVSLYYVGESGSPFTYLAYGQGSRGDLNADGSSLNDPIYVPRNAFDSSEIQFSGLSDSPGADNSAPAQAARVTRQQAAFEQLIQRTPCLRRQRGSILARNSCREPFSHTSALSVRQTIPLRAKAFDVELDVFNVLNLLDARWGLYRVASPSLLQHVGETAGPPAAAVAIFRFDPTRQDWTTLLTESAFQLQLAVHYRF